MDRNQVESAIRETLRKLQISVNADAPIEVERPKHVNHGDWSTNVAMQLSKTTQLNPRDLADKLVESLRTNSNFERVEIAGPGFINFWVKPSASEAIVCEILERDRDFGHSKILSGRTINLEYVSANPTGPLHVGHARWGAFGDALARLLTSQGAKVIREFYFNDHGVQISHFVDSLIAVKKGNEPPENGYRGEYIDAIARALPGTNPETVRAFGVARMTEQIKQSLRAFGVEFDVFFNENSLYADGEVESAIAELRGRGLIYDRDGASWFAATKVGPWDSADRVVIKSNGEMAYLAGDIAYYLNKRRRGADIAVYMLGADHHGYVGRLKSIAAAFGNDPEQTLKVLIGQMVSLKSDGTFARLSKRAGTMVYLDDLLKEIGKDPLRYSLIRSNPNRSLALDLDLITSATTENPVFYVKYVHARCCSLERIAQQRGVNFRGQQWDFSETEKELLSLLSEYQSLLETSAQQFEPYKICQYLETLAAAFHRWYSHHPILPPAGQSPEPINFARLALAAAVRIVINNTLTDLIGIDAPQRM
jgi:arginyl-tRNA synthetase